MATFAHTRREIGRTVIFTPVVRHSATVIFLHGLGDSGTGIADVAEAWARQDWQLTAPAKAP